MNGKSYSPITLCFVNIYLHELDFFVDTSTRNNLDRQVCNGYMYVYTNWYAIYIQLISSYSVEDSYVTCIVCILSTGKRFEEDVYIRSQPSQSAGRKSYYPSLWEAFVSSL